MRCRCHNALAAEDAFGREHVERKIQEKKRGVHQRQRGYDSATALRALVGMGFKEPEARRALVIVNERVADADASIETMLREALAVLT